MPSEDVYSWSVTAADNAGSDAAINWAEGQPRASVNNSARSEMAAVAKWRNLQTGTIVTTGSVNAQIFATDVPYTVIPTGFRVLLKIGAGLTNTDTTTLTMNSLAPVTIKTQLGAELVGGELQEGGYSDFRYDGTNWILLYKPTVFPEEPPVVINAAGRFGGLEIWQRPSPIAVGVAVTQQVNDGWYMLTNAGQTATITRTAGLTTGSVYAATVQRDTGTSGVGILRYGAAFDSDEIYRLRGGFVALSFTAKAGINWSPTSGTLSYCVYTGTGAPAKRGATPYTGEVSVISGTVNLTTTAARTSKTSTVIFPADATQCEVQFFWTPVGTALVEDSFTIDDVQFEAVANASSEAGSYARLPTAIEADMCGRHLRMVEVLVSVNAWTVITNAYTVPAMRATPTCFAQSYTSGSNAVFNLLGSTEGAVTFYQSNPNTADAAGLVQLSAEL